MTLGGYELPLIGTVMPYLLLAFVIASSKVIISRIWGDKELDLKKMGLLIIAIGLAGFALLSWADIFAWVGQVVDKLVSLISSLKVDV